MREEDTKTDRKKGKRRREGSKRKRERCIKGKDRKKDKQTDGNGKTFWQTNGWTRILKHSLLQKLKRT